MEMPSLDSTNNTNSSSTMSKEFYSFRTQDEAKGVSLRKTMCTQVFGICLFAVGLVSGLLIGIYGYHGGPDGHTCLYKFDSAPSSQRERWYGDSDYKNYDDDDSSKYKPKVPQSRQPMETTSQPKEPQSRQPMETTSQSTTRSSTPYPSCKVCDWRNPLQDPKSPELFAPLTSHEMYMIHQIFLEEKIINTKPKMAIELKDSFIHSISLHPPIKAEAVAYLNDNGPFPGRYATVVVDQGAADPPLYMHYKVGPLDNKTRETQHMTITPLLKEGEVEYENRPYTIVEVREFILFVMDQLYKINNVMIDSFNSRSPHEDLSVLPNGPFLEKGNRTSRFTVGLRGIGDMDFDFLNTLPLHGKVYHGGKNLSEWRLYEIYYLNQGPFENVEAFSRAYLNDEIQKVNYPNGTRQATEELTFPVRADYAASRENSHLPGTETFEPVGPRYTISGHDISWLGWSFSITCSQHRGPAVYNVKFKDETVIYENSVSEIGLVYSADGTGQDNIVYFDSTFGLGESKKTIPALDCPEHASYLRNTYWNAFTVETESKNTICVFEKDEQEPLWRHKASAVEGGLRNRYLVVRFPTTIGNYDYIFDFQFFLDGRVVTKVTATGFIQGSFWNPVSPLNGDYPEHTPFGYRVAGSTVGLIHDHTFAFKVDVDVVDRNNSFELIHWKYGNVRDSFKQNIELEHVPNYFVHDTTRYLEWERIKNETAVDIDLKNQKYWTIINDRHRNIWNVSRGYRIIPMASSTQNILDDYPKLKEMSFTNHHCTITKHKDAEQYVKPIYNPKDTNDPDPSKKFLVDMVDGENIDNEDIVAWITLGFLHIPSSEDVPMTTSVSTGFTLKPFNFFDRTAVFDIPALAVKGNTTLDVAPRAKPCLYQITTVRG